VTLNRPAIEPCGECLPNSEIFRRLAARMGLDPRLFADSDQDLIRRAIASPHPLMKGVTWEGLLEHGYLRTAVPDDWRPYAEGGFGTPSGKLEFHSAALEAKGLDPLPTHVAAHESPAGNPAQAARYPLQLVSGKWSLHFLNSSYANLDHHLEAEGEMWVEIDPEDAAARNIQSGDRVRIFNDRGAVVARARIGDRVPAGVVGLPSGWWASRTTGGAGANALTEARITDLGGGAAYHDALVEIEPLTESPRSNP
jgi:anaerobic selenocysteine-containing dehydrogenase